MIPVVIPAYKQSDQLRKCLEHLSRQSVPVDVFVRDNTRDNIYFTAAVNEGIRRYLSRDWQYVAILNQDMYLKPDAAERMVAFMDSHPTCGIAAPVQLHTEDPECVIWAGGEQAFPAGKHKWGRLAEFNFDQEVLWCNGACMMLRRRMVQEIGLLDENFVFLGSDSDYCFTARARGWQVWRVGGAHGFHDCGESARIVDPVLEAIKAEDMLYFGRKWLTGGLYRELAGPESLYAPEQTAEMMSALERIREQGDQPASLTRSIR